MDVKRTIERLRPSAGLGLALVLIAGTAVTAAWSHADGQPQVTRDRATPALVPGAPEVAAQLVDLNLTLRQIQDVLDRLTVHQELDLLMKRIELKVSRGEPLRRRVRTVESDIESAENELEHLAMYQRQQEEAATNDEATDTDREAAERSLREVTDMVELQEARLQTLRLRLIELENDLLANQEEIEFLEEALDERLGLR